MKPEYQNIPTELRAFPQWVTRKGKVPYNPRTGKAAKAGVPDTWVSFEDAIQSAHSTGYTGIGFQFNANGIVGIDFDHCIENGSIAPWVSAWIDNFNSYTEISPSGSGIHILCRGNLPEKAVKTPKAEMYDRGRYFTITGEVYGEHRHLRHAQPEIEALYAEIAKPAPEMLRRLRDLTSAPVKGSYLDTGLGRDKRFKALWDGQRTSSDESGNDQALMNKLAYWCNCNAEAMISAFLDSPHCAQKDEKHWKKSAERKDYLQRTAQQAIVGCNTTAEQDNLEFQQNRRITAVQDFAASTAQAATIQSPEDLKRYSLDDIGTAKLFADVFRGLIMYVPEYKSFFTYYKGVWQRDPDNLKTKQYIKQLSDMLQKIIPPSPKVNADGQAQEDVWEIYRKHYQKYRALKYRETLCKDAKDELSGSLSAFDRQPFLFNCKNGTLDLNTGVLKPHDPADMLSKMAKVVYNPAASCSRFIQFIDEITEGKQDRTRMLQKALGYCLKGEANEECYFTVIGQKTRNGKGTLFDTVMNIFGDYGVQIGFDSLSRNGPQDGSRATPDLARLAGVRLALSNEPGRGVYVNEALMKQLTGNDDITARPLYGDVVQFKPVFRLFVTANSKPSVSDDSLFASDRIKLLPFTKHFNEEERDTNLKSVFRTEEAKSGILNWLLEGYRLYQQEGLKNTPEMDALTAEYRKENDLVGQYLEDRVSFDTTKKTTVKALRVDYETWCRVVGAKPFGLQLFKAELGKRDIEILPFHKQAAVQCEIRVNRHYED